MLLFITIEAQNADKNGLLKILNETKQTLNFVTDKSKNLEEQNNYGTEFECISIIPSFCIRIITIP